MQAISFMSPYLNLLWRALIFLFRASQLLRYNSLKNILCSTDKIYIWNEPEREDVFLVIIVSELAIR
jgi:hypothetical protein